MPFTNLLNQINIALNKLVIASNNITNPANIVDGNLSTIGTINDNLDGNFIIDLDGIFTLAKQTISPTPPGTKMGLEIEFNTNGTTPPLPTGTWTVETSKDNIIWAAPINITLPSNAPYVATVYFPIETYAQLVKINIPINNLNVEIKECRIYIETQIIMATNLFSDTAPIQNTIDLGSRLPAIIDSNSPYEKWINIQGDTNIDSLTKGCFVHFKKGTTQYPLDTASRNFGIISDKSAEECNLHLTFTSENDIKNPPHGTNDAVTPNNIYLNNENPALFLPATFGKGLWCASSAQHLLGADSWCRVPYVGQQGSYNIDIRKGVIIVSVKLQSDLTTGIRYICSRANWGGNQGELNIRFNGGFLSWAIITNIGVALVNSYENLNVSALNGTDRKLLLILTWDMSETGANHPSCKAFYAINNGTITEVTITNNRTTEAYRASNTTDLLRFGINFTETGEYLNAALTNNI